jgi:hypothetical protein
MKSKTAILAIFIFLVCSSSVLADDCCFRFCFPDSCCPCGVRNDFGKAYTLAVAGQILNPDAEMNLAPVEGLDGRAAVIIMQKYEASFAKQQGSQAGGGMTSVAVSQAPGGYAQ